MADTEVGLISMPDLDNANCEFLYNSLYTSMKTAQDGKSTITLDVRLKNAAYSFASPIASIVGSGGTGGSGTVSDAQLATLVKKKGDTMTGELSVLYGLKAGIDGTMLLSMVLDTDQSKYIKIDGKTKIASSNLYIDDKIIFNHYTDATTSKETLDISGGAKVNFGSSDIYTTGLLSVGESFIVSSSALAYNGKDIYHSGNSNLGTVDWTMKNGTVSGTLSVNGTTTLSGALSSLYGADFGINGTAMMSITKTDSIDFNGDINLGKNYGIKINGLNVIHNASTDSSDLQISGIGGYLILGGTTTSSIKLWNTLTTEAGDHNLIDKNGNCNFMNTINIGYGYGDTLLSTVQNAVLIHNQLKFGTSTGSYFTRYNSGVSLCSPYLRTDNTSVNHTFNTYFSASTSQYKDLSKNTETVFFDTDADFFTYNKPIEAKTFIGLTESTTRLYDNVLYFSSNNYLANIQDGIKHYGNSYFNGNLSSVDFSTGFAGTGFAIRKKTDNNNIEITADELLIRKKIRAYEFDVQRESVTNGSLWVSSSCSGDIVELI